MATMMMRRRRMKKNTEKEKEKEKKQNMMMIMTDGNQDDSDSDVLTRRNAGVNSSSWTSVPPLHASYALSSPPPRSVTATANSGARERDLETICTAGASFFELITRRASFADEL
eukprot:2081548-Rhodomonas_salina.1